MDGRKVPVSTRTTEYAVAFDDRGHPIDHPRVQRYVNDPSYWMKDTIPGVMMVRIYPVAAMTWNGRALPSIIYSEAGVREFDHRG